MFQGVYKIADTVVAIHSIDREVQELCADYRYTGGGLPEFTIVTTMEDVEFERNKSYEEDRLEGIPLREFTNEYLETLAVYRKLAVKLLDKDTLLFHGSVIAVDGEGYLFTAKSGTGKSTHTKLWREKFGERAVMVNDDKPLIRLVKGKAVVYGTPWDGKHRLSSNTSVPLKALCILERAKENSIRRITMSEALPMLFQQSYRPNGKGEMLATMQLIARLGTGVKLYRLGCNMDKEAATVAYEGMQE